MFNVNHELFAAERLSSRTHRRTNYDPAATDKAMAKTVMSLKKEPCTETASKMNGLTKLSYSGCPQTRSHDHARSNITAAGSQLPSVTVRTKARLLSWKRCHKRAQVTIFIWMYQVHDAVHISYLSHYHCPSHNDKSDPSSLYSNSERSDPISSFIDLAPFSPSLINTL
jgi:hypothetical protein